MDKQTYKRPDDTYVRRRKINEPKQQFKRPEDTYL